MIVVCMNGNPMMIRHSSVPPAIISTLGCDMNCFERSAFMLFSDALLVTIIPDATDTRSAGICDIRPSPTVAVVYMPAIVEKSPSPCIKPIMIPPIRFMNVTTIDIIESPLTNFDAPSIDPKKSASRWILLLLRLASRSSIVPALRSASIAICLPGIASSVKRADTSATLSEPLVITRKFTKTIIRNMISPTTTCPLITKSPNAFTISPA